MIITKTPLRISLLGGGTDYPEWFTRNGGAILGTTINKYCHICYRRGNASEYFDLPTRSGMATSSAFTVGILRAINTEMDRLTIARIAIKLEREKSGNSVGHQDQYLCSLGGMLHIKFSSSNTDISQIDSKMTFLEDHLMLFEVGRRTSSPYAEIQEQLAHIQDNFSILKEIHSLVDEGVHHLDDEEFGRLLHQTWELKRRLGEHVSNPGIDTFYDNALMAGAIGGKLLGGGGGGFFLLYVPPDKKADIIKRLDMLPTPFNFESEGTKIIFREVSC